MSESLLEYYVPIESKSTVNDEFIIEGIALNETTTSNGHVFLGEELQLAASTLKGVPLLKDHDNSVDAIVGRVRDSTFDEINKCIPFKAVVKDKEMQQKIENGLIGTVSVGAQVDPKDITENEDGTITPHNIIFRELSLVAVPADEGATFTKSLNNAYKLFKSNSTNINQISERGKENMTKEQTLSEDKTVTESKAEEILVKLEKAKLELAETELALVEKKLSSSKEKLSEADIDEEPETKEEPEVKTEEETKEVEEESEADAEDEEDTVEEKGKYNITQGHNSFSYERDSYVY